MGTKALARSLRELNLQVAPTPLGVGMEDGARMIGLSKRQLENYVALQLIPSKKIGRRRILLVWDLRKFLASDRPTAGPWHSPKAQAPINEGEGGRRPRAGLHQAGPHDPLFADGH